MDKTICDNDLLHGLKSGSKEAFSAIYERYWNTLFILAHRVLEDKEAAKDAVQEVFISFYEHLHDRSIVNLRAYLFQCVKYQCFMKLRSGRISEKHLSRINKASSSNFVEEEIEAEELKALLETKIATLPVKCREVFMLSRFESLPNKKIAEQLNISPKTVENQISKALKALRTSVEKLASITFLILSEIF